MRRAALAVVILVVAAVPAIAIAHRTATGATKRAILQSLKVPGPVNNGHNCQTRALPCWRVLVSAKTWATAQDVGPGNNGMGEWTFIDHFSHHRWLYVGGWGEGIGFACSKDGMPQSVVHDLGIYCTP